MNNEKNKKIEEILSSLDATQRARTPDFFYTRLKARMEKELEKGTRGSWVLRPVYAFTGLILLLALNAAIIFRGEEKPDTTAVADTETAQSVAAEYNLTDNYLTYEINQ